MIINFVHLSVGQQSLPTKKVNVEKIMEKKRLITNSCFFDDPDLIQYINKKPKTKTKTKTKQTNKQQKNFLFIPLD